MAAEPTSRRRRGRPRKPKAAKAPRIPPLPFQETRDHLAAALRGARNRQKRAGPAPQGLQTLAAVATTGLVPVDSAVETPRGMPFRFALTPAQFADATEAQAKRAQYNIKGLAANSLRTRESDWLTWMAFCAHYDRVVLPASFDDLADFIHELIAAKRKKATIEHILWSIANVHTRHRLVDPMAHPEAADFWRDRVREDLSGEQAQAAPLHKALLTRLLVAMETAPAPHRRVQPRLRGCVVAAQRRRRHRDIAMLHVAYDLLTRASELVGLEWSRVKRARNGGGLYRFGKTKTDQAGKGTEHYLRPETMQALDRWLAESPYHGAFVFHPVSDDIDLPLDDATSPEERAAWQARIDHGRAMEKGKLTQREVGVVFRRACAAAGVDLHQTWLSGHSARVGGAQDMAEAGLSTVEMQIAGRWASERMPAHYAAQVRATQTGERRHRKVKELEPDMDPG